MNIKLATVNLEVADAQRSKRFYVDVLGMTENAQRSQPPAFVYLQSTGCDMTLATSAGDARPEPSPTIELGFEVDDIRALDAHFAALGVTGFVPQNMGWGEVREGHDPDGHRVIVYCVRRE